MRGLVSVVLMLAVVAPSTLAALLAVDYGAEWTKASLVKPGVPFDVLLDRDSKRKMMSTVGWKKDERLFGGDAAAVAARFPEAHYPYVKPLLAGTTIPNNTIYPSPPYLSPDNGRLVFRHPKAPTAAHNIDGAAETTWTPEEILAQQLAYVKGLASAAANEDVKDLFMTVPSYFTQAQRRALKDAAEVAGLSLTGIISEAGAVGLNYAMTRNFPTKEYHMIYDSGALKTTATILSFETKELPIESPLLKGKSKKTFKPKMTNTTIVEVIAFDSEQELGGAILDERLREVLIEEFLAQDGNSAEDIRHDSRALRKLWREASKLKQVLSANNEASASVESLINDIDFRTRVSRTKFEEVCANEASRFSKPIINALRLAGMTQDQLDSVIFFGGNTRVPMVQAAVRTIVGDDKIAQNVNTDEAAVMGAAFYGASQGRAFQSKLKMKLLEKSPYEIGYESGKEYGVVFPAYEVAERQSLSFKPTDDITVDFKYTGSNIPSPAEISRLEIHGIHQAVANLTKDEVEESNVSVNVKLDNRGILHTANAVLTYVTKPEAPSVANKLKGLFGGNKDKVQEGEDGEKADDKTEEELALEQPKEKKIGLRFTEHATGIKPMSAEERRNAKKRLAAINAVEMSAIERGEAVNHLEGYLYRLKNMLGADAPNKALQDFSSSHEKVALSKAVEEAFEWMAEYIEAAETAVLRKKRETIEAMEKPIIRRFQEFSGRNRAIDDFQKAIVAGRAWFDEASRNMTEAISLGNLTRWTQEELDGVKTMLQESEAWAKEKMAAQKAVGEAMHVDPVLLNADLDSRGKALQSHVLGLQKKPMPKPPKSKKAATATSTSVGSEQTGKENDDYPEADTVRTAEDPEPTQVYAHEEL
ncbi:hypothetical protein QFC22_003082 [Naganishia vaughanmartiniae]|uniref:Uncharacterized protein n=1 Tax=Naganishia vaughanmartiniae TaxID=1424756 RepID=A0ACC2X995_9TREE|nr:hypothetical protein QFC22_003082 [Naganishia vaughanmartiniae]